MFSKRRITLYFQIKKMHTIIVDSSYAHFRMGVFHGEEKKTRGTVLSLKAALRLSIFQETGSLSNIELMRE